MKRKTAAGIAFLLVLCLAPAGCADTKADHTGTDISRKAEETSEAGGGSAVYGENVVSGANAVSEEKVSGLWPETEMPAALRYDRLWVYSAYEETEDPEVIKQIVDAVKSLEVQGKEETAADDYTDILLFTFADGHTYRVKFEGECWISEENGRLHVEGLTDLRFRLDDLLGEKALR